MMSNTIGNRRVFTASTIQLNELFSTNFNRGILCEHLRVNDSLKQARMNSMLRQKQHLTDISQLLKDDYREEQVSVAKRKQLRQNCVELRQLDVQIRVASASNELAEQRATNAEKKRELARTQVELREAVEAERLRTMDSIRELEQADRDKKVRFRSVLLEQMEEARQRRVLEIEEVIRERDRRLAEQRQLVEEERQVVQECARRKVRLRNDMIAFINVQRNLHKQQKIQREIEYTANMKLQKERDLSEQLQKAGRIAALQKQQARSEEIGQRVYLMELEKRQHEDQMIDLRSQESTAKDEERYRQEKHKIEKNRLYARQDLARFRAESLAKHGYGEHHKSLDKFGTSLPMPNHTDEAERAFAARQKLQRQKHRQAILALIEQNRYKREMAVAEMNEFQEKLNNAENERQKLIDSERISMLRTQPPEILARLPLGVIHDSDWQHLPSAAKNKAIVRQ